MNEVIGKVFSIGKENSPIDGCTISKDVTKDIHYFSLGASTDISAEIYTYKKLIIMNAGELEIYTKNYSKQLVTGEMLFTEIGVAVGMNSKTGAVYTEIEIRGETDMNKIIKTGEVYKLGDLVPYQKDRIVNMDIMSNDKMKFVVMSFDEGTGLSEHAAPGSAMIFALDGEAIITYEGVDHTIKAGENFTFAPSGRHAVKATKQFKMALLIQLD